MNNPSDFQNYHYGDNPQRDLAVARGHVHATPEETMETWARIANANPVDPEELERLAKLQNAPRPKLGLWHRFLWWLS